MTQINQTAPLPGLGIVQRTFGHSWVAGTEQGATLGGGMPDPAGQRWGSVLARLLGTTEQNYGLSGTTMSRVVRDHASTGDLDGTVLKGLACIECAINDSDLTEFQIALGTFVGLLRAGTAVPDTDTARITYSGSDWTVQAADIAFNASSVHETTVADATASLDFHGPEIDIVIGAFVGDTGGTTEVRIDGELVGDPIDTNDLITAGYGFAFPALVRYAGLADTDHTIELRNTAGKTWLDRIIAPARVPMPIVLVTEVGSGEADFNQVMRDLADSYEDGLVIVADLEDLTGLTFQPGGDHPDAEGAQLIAETLAPAFRRAIAAGGRIR